MTTLPAELADAHPSEKLVFLILLEEGPLIGDRLQVKTHLPRTTFYEAVQRLEERDLVERRRAYGDRRVYRYYVTRTPSPD